MPKGIYKRTKPAWNKGKKGIYSKEARIAMGKNPMIGEKNGMYKPNKTRRNEPNRKKPDKCEVCYDTESIICYDHDHATGNFRGWLCTRCNVAVGMAKDNPKILRNLARFIETHCETTRPKRISESLLEV